jgi:hypothetical protein
MANSLISLAEQGERDPLVLRRFALSRARELLEPPHPHRQEIGARARLTHGGCRIEGGG